MTTPDQYLTFEKLMRRLAQLSSATIAYGTAILATIALSPDMQLPPELATLARSLGASIVVDILKRMAKGEEIKNEELLEKLEQANADLEKSLRREDFFPAYAHLLTKFRESHREHQIILEKIENILKAINQEVELTLEEEAYYLNLYLQEVQQTTKRLPWGYALSVISPDLEISQIYVPPTLVQQDSPRPVPIIQDEKQERDQERREKKANAQTTARMRPVVVDIYELIGSKTPVSIIGFMGTGKSLTAHYIAWLLTKKDELRSKGFSEPKTPLLIRLGDPVVAEAMVFSTSIFDIATRHFSSTDKSRIIQVLKKEWRNGHIVLILDALDEYSGTLDTMKREIEYLVESALPGNHIILTSRPSQYRLARPAGFRTVELNELESHALDRYVRKWVEALLPTSDRSDIPPQDHTNALKDQIAQHPLVEDMVSNPLLLTILVALSLTSRGIDLSSVENETDLYQQYIDYIIAREKEKPSFRRPENLSDLMLEVVYGYVGYLVHVARTKQTPRLPDVHELVDKISRTRYFSNVPNGMALTETCIRFWEKTGLFVEQETVNRKIGFRHQAFQFFGAALGLKYLTEESRESRLEMIGNDPQWFDVLRLYLGVKPASDLSLE